MQTIDKTKLMFEDLTKEQLWALRNEIVLNSIYIADYENSFGFNSRDISYFFDGFMDYICELAEEDGITETTKGNDFLEIVFNNYDNEENLYGWFCCCEDYSWVKKEVEEDEYAY